MKDHVALLLDDIGRRRQPLRERDALDLELAQPFSHLVRCQRSVGGEVKQPLFLNIKIGQFFLDAEVSLALGVEPVVETGRHLLAHSGDLVRGQLQRLHFTQHGLFNQRDRQMRQVASMILSAHAQEVFVGITMAVDRLRVDELTISPFGVAASATEHRPEKVGMDDVALIALHPHIEDALDPLEEFRSDERFVPARIDLPLIGHHPQVVRIAQDGPEFAPRDHLLLPPGRAPGRQSLVGQLLL